MHTFSETGAGVPAFLAKLWRLVEDPETNNLICWSKDGRSFIIQNQAQFARELLPLNYKHNNMASFIRQLNMYGFHKITSIDNGGLKFDRDEMEFTHPCFKRNCPYLLEHIKRKIASNKSIDEKCALKPEAVTKVLQDVKAMRGRQDSLDSRFSVMKQENEALWREIASLRQKHAKQQQIVNKLIQFLITIVQPQRNMTSVKRHMQLMINDTPAKSKLRRTSESESEFGPVIHELGEELLDEVSDVEPELMVPNSPFIRVSTPATPTFDHNAEHSPHIIERPQSSVSVTSQNFDFSNQSAEDSSEYLNPTTGVTVNENIIQTINNDGSKIFYHITEVPDTQPQETSVNPDSFNEDNVLTTPMVRKEMARNQMLKQKNRQRRFKNESLQENHVKVIESSNINLQPSVKEQQEDVPQVPQPMQIKSEQDLVIDPMSFLSAYSNNRDLTPDPNFCEDSNNTGSFLINPTSSAIENDLLNNSSSELYNPNSFINSGIPVDIFDDNTLTSNEESSHIDENDDFKEAQQKQFRRNSGKFLTGSTESTLENEEIGPNNSATTAENFENVGDDNNIKNYIKNFVSPSPSTLEGENINNKTITKYKNNPDLMRNDVSGHLDIVQDELESLKDLLRSDVYSLDQNALLSNKNHQIYLPAALEMDILNKLFNDSGILEPYDLQLSSDASTSNNKKGSELMTKQPMYDLSDIINDQNDLDGDDNMPSTSTLKTQQKRKQEFSNCSSVLNTPCHE